LVKYLTISLTSYLNQSTHVSFIKVQSSEGSQPITDMFELGYDWLRGICDAMISLVSQPEWSKKNDEILNAISTSIDEIIKTILPQFTNSIYEMAFIYSSLGKCINALPTEKMLSMANSTVALRLGTLVLNLPDGKEVELLLNLISSIFKCLENTSSGYDNVLTGGILSSIGCICRCRTSCADSASNLYNLGEMISKKSDEQKNHDEEGVHLMDVITNTMDTEDFQPLIEIISSSIADTGSSSSSPFNNWQRRPLSLSDQSSGLLMSLSLLHVSISSPGMKPDDALSFLQSFLQCYPRLASRAIPSVIDIARTCLTNIQAATTLIKLPLEFLSDPCVVSDPHSASLVWSFMSSLVSEEVPATIRSTVIRLLPRMCLSNKRLFRRVMGIIGKAMVAQDPIMRISGTAALAELAQLDLLRDIEQIIGSVQNSLTDEEPAVLYNALDVLRYLIVNEELEFDLVIKVLEKRLNITISDVDTVLGLNILVLEGLVSLLGEGGLEEEDDDDGSNGEGPEPSPQLIKAVSLLVNLALKGDSGWDEDEAIRLQQKIYDSLANYSSTLLGLDSEAVRGWNGIDTLEENSEEVRRFIDLKTIVINGLSLAKLDALLESVSKISKTMLLFEEDVHGSSLFKGSSSSSSNKADKGRAGKQPRISKSILSSLPSASAIEVRYQDDPRSSTATAVLYSIGFAEDTPLDTESILTQISECFGDIVNEPLIDPAYQAIKICSLIYSFNSIWKSIQSVDDGIREELTNKAVSQLSDEWSETVGEYAYVAMSAFALSIDDDPACSAGVTSIQNTILEGQDNYLFENDDIKILCLSMITARLCRTTDARVDGLIDSIEKFLLENSQQVCFGSLFGLAIIMSNLGEKSNDTDSSDTWRRERSQRILSIILTAFNSCLTQECDVVVFLAESLGEANYDQLSEMSSDYLDSLNVKDGCHLKLKAVLIALGHSFPTLRSISGALLKSVVDLLNKLPWGSGKGLVLYAAYKAAADSDVMTQTELSEAITAISNYVQESDDDNGVGDALLALVSFCQLSKDETKQEVDLVVAKCREIKSDASSSDDDKLMAILAACASIGELPGLVVLTPSIHPSLKKSFVVDIVEFLEGMTNDAEKLKLRDASATGLGMLCAMSNQGRQMQKKSASANKFSNIQAKEGSLLLGILQEVEIALQRGSINKLSCLFSALESIAIPGSFSKVIELALNGSSNEVKVSCLKLLASQLEPGRRRIGFDGRGFVDLYTRLAKMAVDQLQALISVDGMSIFVSMLPNIVYQLPTTVAGELATSYLWAISKASSQSMVAYLHGLMAILASANNDKNEKSAPRKTISPALLRSFHKHITTQVFSDLCENQVDTKSVWAEYLQCLGIIPSAVVSESADLNGDITTSNVYGLAICSQSPKATRKVESWIARHETESSPSSLRVLILPILITAMQSRNDNEMRDSILSLFDVMLVKGVDNMSLYLIVAKVAFWFDSRSVSKQLQHYLDLPSDRTSNMSSFFVGEELMFDANKLSSELLITMFDGFIDDLPTKLAVLCNIWKISDDISNRASRILSDSSTTKNDGGVARVLSCMERIVKTIEGGEVKGSQR